MTAARPRPRRTRPLPFSERAFHEWARRRLPAGRAATLPLGDDTAAIPLGEGRVALLTTDALVEGIHFPADAPPAAVGEAVAAASLSDIAAKGGQPLALLVDLLIPANTPPRWAQQVTLGAERAMARFGAHLVGGDTKPAPRRSVVGTVLGIAPAGRLVPRSAGRPGDVLAVTGAVGRGGWASLHWGERHRARGREAAELVRIRPRVREGQRLARRAHAMLDTSDGLAEAAHLLAAASHLKVILESTRLPLHPGLVRERPSETRKPSLAFFGGDYELLAALPASAVGAARRALLPLGCPFTVVGRLERGRGAWIDDGRRRRRLPRAGWQPFVSFEN